MNASSTHTRYLSLNLNKQTARLNQTGSGRVHSPLVSACGSLLAGMVKKTSAKR